jgi:molecular chaperone GrpE
MELIYNKFRKILEAQGIKPIEALGKPFDPHLHEALLQMPRNDVPPHTVIEEVDKGYMLNDKVLRHSKVVVAADSSPGEETPGGAGGPEREETR